MKAGGKRDLIELLGLEYSFSRPRTSDDNPFSEAQFRTLKNQHNFPNFFRSLPEAEEFQSRWFRWYNFEHRHTGLNLHTPANVHIGKVDEVIAGRQKAMDLAFAKTPSRFSKGRPIIEANPAVVGSNLLYRHRQVLVENPSVVACPVAKTGKEIYTE